MKTLKLTVYLWRNGLPADADCWDSGTIYVPAKERKLPGKGTLFNKLDDLPKAIAKELKAAGLTPTNQKEEK